jgi:hypothetical protein
MENYVLLYYFDDAASTARFEEAISKEFRRHQIEKRDNLKYFGFADREEPGVVDKLNAILRRIGIGTKDYVALYYSRKEDRDKIKRGMLVGHDELVETKINKISFDSYRNNLTNLLNFDYVKAQPEVK